MSYDEPALPGTPRYFELSIYTPSLGKAPALLERFRNHTLRLFERHGMCNLGYWMSDEDPPRLFYLLAHDGPAAAKKSWSDFGADPEWQQIYEKSMAGGRLITDHVKIGLEPTDFSPLQ